MSSDQAIDVKRVFVVHGRDLRLRDALFHLLRTLGLSPLEWEQAVSETGTASPYIGDILRIAFHRAQAVVVLLSGDDEARLRPELASPQDPSWEASLSPQARPNVLFEAGLAFAYCPDRTILVQIGQTRPFSDIAGRHVILFQGTAVDRHRLKERLRIAGCAIDDSGTEWLSAGDFVAASTAASKSSRALDIATEVPIIPIMKQPRA